MTFLTAFIVCLIFFLQLRIADEFKDAEEDRTYRPYRPVPRGLVSLQELRIVFAMGATIQVFLTWLLFPGLIFILFIAWIYLGLMSVEFFARDWLKARPLTYLWTHMLIMPIVDFFATACYWLPEKAAPPLLVFFLAASFCNGLVIEIGRKIRVRDDEEEGVPTYSKLWGVRRAAVVWLACMAATFGFATVAAIQIAFFVPVLVGLGIFLLLSGWQTFKFITSEVSAKRFEVWSGLWTLALYLFLGLIPLVFSIFRP